MSPEAEGPSTTARPSGVARRARPGTVVPGGARLETTFEAVVFTWESTVVAGREGDKKGAPRLDERGWRQRVEALCNAGVHVGIFTAAGIDRLDSELRARPSGPGTLRVFALDGSSAHLVEATGPRLQWRWSPPSDAVQALRWLLADLYGLGIGPGLVLLIGHRFAPGAVDGDDFFLQADVSRATLVSVQQESGVPEEVRQLGGGPAGLAALLDEQIERRRRGRVPTIDRDPAWTLELRDAPRSRRVHESLLTLADRWYGTRGSLEEDGPGTSPMVLATGVYQGGPRELATLLRCPRWLPLEIEPPEGTQHRRVLDLRTGVLLRESLGGESRLRTLRFVSLARPGTMGLRAEGGRNELMPAPAPQLPAGQEGGQGRLGEANWARTVSGLGGGAVSAAVTTEQEGPGLKVIERLANYVADPYEPPSSSEAVEGLEQARLLGFERLLAQQRATWAACWDQMGVWIVGDPDTELAVRLALFHLVSSVPNRGEAAVGARGLSGPAYLGHVFWDADVFVLPVMAALDPPAARAMLEYRVNRLDDARRNAAFLGYRGARFPWESAHSGVDVTPTSVRGESGEVIPIRTGQREDHIVADIAWAAMHYAAWTGDLEFLEGDGRTLLTETARFWASRIRMGGDGRAHIYGVIGPDEYHEPVDDNAFTNVMARWNLRRAAELAEQGDGKVSSEEVMTWRTLAAMLVDGFDPRTGTYEQFAGYFGLEPLAITELAEPPVAADLLLGRERVVRSQILKQADVLMLHHLLPDEVAHGSLRPNLDFYQPRTAHGSSLSPAIHASLLARAGEPDAALDLLRIACRLDLDDLTGSTSAGLHIATMGGVWQAIAYGFAGLWPAEGVLRVNPHLPTSWDELELRFRWQGKRVRLRARHDGIDIDCEAPLALEVGGGRPVPVAPPGGGFSSPTRTGGEVRR